MSGPAELPPQYLFAPMTGRGANALAHRYGFRNSRALAADVPEGGVVADIGAGRSPLGRLVAAARPDITWVNFDYRYNDPQAIEKLRAKAPENVEYVAGDILEPPEELTARRYDRLYSFWMLPHLTLESSEPAAQALDTMLSLTRESGTLRLGPTKWYGYQFFGKSFVEIRKQNIPGAEERAAYIGGVVARLTPEASTRVTQRALNVLARREQLRENGRKLGGKTAIDEAR